jgi:hypothetical protein
VGTSRKPLILAFIVVLAASFLMVEVASAVQPILNPSPSQFTVYLFNSPYEVPATTPVVTVDPYTGEQKQVTLGTASYTADNVTIQLWILNEQPTYSNGTTNFTPPPTTEEKQHGHTTDKEVTEPFIESHVGFKYVRLSMLFFVFVYLLVFSFLVCRVGDFLWCRVIFLLRTVRVRLLLLF